MADQKITDLDAVTTLADTDLFEVVVDVGGTPTNKKIAASDVATELGGGAGYAGVTTGGTGSLDFAQGTKTADEPFIDGTVTWNNSGVAFNGIKLAVTVTAAALNSNLIDLQVGGTSQFKVRLASSGQYQVNIPNGTTSLPGITGSDTNTGIRFEENPNWITFVSNGAAMMRVTDSNLQILPAGGISQVSGGPYRWNSSTRLLDLGNGILQVEGNSGNQGVALVLGADHATNGVRLKRNTGRMEARTGSDSAYCQFTCEKLGVNNSAAATSPGSVTKKMEVFDASGSSLGFVAIYDAIT